jgi:hypothetical protein
MDDDKREEIRAGEGWLLVLAIGLVALAGASVMIGGLP